MNLVANPVVEVFVAVCVDSGLELSAFEAAGILHHFLEQLLGEVFISEVDNPLRHVLHMRVEVEHAPNQDPCFTNRLDLEPEVLHI